MSRRFDLFIPLGLGLFAFLLVTGGAILLPGNIAWLASGDPRQHYLGWAFFRQTPWSFPLGLNPRFGLELGSAVAFSDSLPLFAIPFKALAGWLPPVFQYFGLWTLACFLLQAVFAWKLCGFLTRDRLARAAMAGFFVFAPPMLWRLHGHLSLVGHFLILAALYLAFASRERRRSAGFLLLVSAAAAVHAYLLAMVAAIWLASLADGILRRRSHWRPAIAELSLGLALAALVCWQVGYFSVGEGVSGGGYGFYRMNVLSLVDPDGWSRFLPSIPTGEGDYEGFNYLGLGLLLLALASLPALGPGFRALRRHAAAMPFLVLLALGLAAFAVTNVVGVAGFERTVPIPGVLERAANVFRSSGRMFWPVYYLLVLAILLVFLRAQGLRRARWILPLALLVQVADTSAGWTFREAQLTRAPASAWDTPMRDPFWEEAARRYGKIRWVLPDNHSPHWAEISAFAATHGLSTDATFLARIGSDELHSARGQAQQRLLEGRTDPDTLYLLDLPSARFAVDTLPADALLASIDGFRVLGPGWRACTECRQDYGFDRAALYGPPALGRDIAFEQGGEGAAYLTYGWGEPEVWGVWSGNDTVRLDFAEPLPPRFRLTLRAEAFGPNVDEAFELATGGASVPFRLGPQLGEVTLDVAAPSPTNRIEIRVPRAVSPRELGINADVRRLGIGLASLRIDPVQP